jgi:hypothetical protein
MLHFFDVEGRLVRRWVPGQRRVAMEVWSGDGWAPYPQVDEVSRRGVRLDHDKARALLQKVREASGTSVAFSAEEAAAALASRQRRA